MLVEMEFIRWLQDWLIILQELVWWQDILTMLLHSIWSIFHLAFIVERMIMLIIGVLLLISMDKSYSIYNSKILILMFISVILLKIKLIGWIERISRLFIGFISLKEILILKASSGISIEIQGTPFLIFFKLPFQILFLIIIKFIYYLITSRTLILLLELIS